MWNPLRGDRITIAFALFTAGVLIVAGVDAWLLVVRLRAVGPPQRVKVDILWPRNHAELGGTRVTLRARIEAGTDVPVKYLLDGAPIPPEVWAQAPSQ